MGVNLPQPQPVSVTPAANDQANSVVSGKFTAVGASAPIGLYGACNLMLWGSVNTALTTTAGSNSASVASGTGLVAGQTIVSVNVPSGTTIGSVAGTSVTLAFPNGYTAASVVGGVDGAALFIGTATSASVQLERSADGGATWVICGTGGAGQAVYSNPAAISTTIGEPERGMAYRLNCTSYASGTINYRISATGQAAMSFAIPTV